VHKISVDLREKIRKLFHADGRKLKTQMGADDFMVITRKSKGKTDLL
jgi:hypothetical protein